MDDVPAGVEVGTERVNVEMENGWIGEDRRVRRVAEPVRPVEPSRVMEIGSGISDIFADSNSGIV